MVNLRFIAGVVDRVIDGDTIRVRLDGARYTVRLTGIDTSETKHPTLGVQPFGPEASAYTTTRLTGATVRLDLDPAAHTTFVEQLAALAHHGARAMTTFLDHPVLPSSSVGEESLSPNHPDTSSRF